jgi:nucleoside phosphorylase
MALSIAETHMTSRLDARTEARHERFLPDLQGLPALPSINWPALNAEAPRLLDTPTDGLPLADVVVLTWSECEWAALQHVFVHGNEAMPYAESATGGMEGWLRFQAGIPEHDRDDWTFWGYYRLVEVHAKRVLLFKSNTHLDWPGEPFLADLVHRIHYGCKPELILSIGTAGGTRPEDHIGAVNVVNSGCMYDADKPRDGWRTYEGRYSPPWSIVDQRAFSDMLCTIPSTSHNLAVLARQFNRHFGTNYPLDTLNDRGLCNPTAVPAVNNLTVDKAPLLTASTFVVGTTSGEFGEFACLEMDDAVIARVLLETDAEFAFVRNISDPAQNGALPLEVQGNWGSAVYEAFGLYTSYNGALTAWAIVAASS